MSLAVQPAVSLAFPCFAQARLRKLERGSEIVPGVSAAGLRLGASIDVLPYDEEVGAFLAVPVKDRVVTGVFYHDVKVFAGDRKIIGILVEGEYKGAFDNWLRIGTPLSSFPKRTTPVNTRWIQLQGEEGLYIQPSDPGSAAQKPVVTGLFVTRDTDLLL
jgi:hypothetical protein